MPVEIIYSQNIIIRFFKFFFYYWTVLITLLFLGVLLGCIVLCIGTLSGYFEYKNDSVSLTKNEAWGYLFLVGAFTAGAVYYLVKSVKNMLKPKSYYSGSILEKKDGDYDEGWAYFIKIKNCEKEFIEINEKAYRKLKQQNLVDVVFSNKLNQVLEIRRN